MPALAEAPAPAAAPAAPAPAAVGSVMPTSAGVINVVPEPLQPADPPKAGSAKDRLFSDLRKKAGVEEPVKSAPAKPTDPKSAAVATKEGAEPPVEGEVPPVTAAAPAVSPEERKKVSPWKLVEQFKERLAQAESRALELEKGVLPEDKRKLITERFQSLDKRNRELEEEIRYVNFSKSKEFTEKYQQPYEKAWSRAMGELNELTLTDPQSGEARTVQPADLLELVNMPLPKAREAAVQLFGDFADDVMAHRKELRGLYEQQAAALEEARKSGESREQQRTQSYHQFQKQVAKEVGEQWNNFNQAAAKDEKYGKYFSPVEGDAEGNTRLEKGFKLVDQAFAENPFAPNLKPEDRAAIVKRHAVVRNRAAAFGRLVAQISKSDARISELTKELEQFKSSTPESDGGKLGTTAPAFSNSRDGVFAALRKLAK